MNKTRWMAHRYSYFLHYGEFDHSLHVCHTCDNPSCVNPEHLFLGTHEDNMKDMTTKGRAGQRGRGRKLSREKVEDILRSTDSNRTLAKKYGVNPSLISRIRSGKVWVSVN